MKKIYLLLALASCQTFNPQVPEPPIPQAWKETCVSDPSFEEKGRFWELFQDPTLNAIVEKALAANDDLKIALSRVQEARSQVQFRQSERWPHIDLNGSVNQDEMLIDPGFYGSSKKLERVKQSQYNLSTSFSYELDLWGKLKDQEQASENQWKASEWAYEFAYQTLVTEVAGRYFSLRSIEEEIRFLQKAQNLWRNTVHLHHCRVEAGLDPEVNLSRAKLELASIEAELEQLYKSRKIEENGLAFLMGEPPSSCRLTAGTLPIKVPPIPAVLPSDILFRRADIQEACSLVAAGKNEVNAALKEYFPSFPLTASIGFVSPLLSNFFEWRSRYWSYLLTVVQSVFDGGKRDATVLAAKARFEKHFATYQKTVNQAFRDVEDSLSTLYHTAAELEAQQRALTASQDTVSLAEEQFNQGIISYLLVADVENACIQTHRKVITLQGQQILAWIRLMKSLGIERRSPYQVNDTSSTK